MADDGPITFHDVLVKFALDIYRRARRRGWAADLEIRVSYRHYDDRKNRVEFVLGSATSTATTPWFPQHGDLCAADWEFLDG